VTILSVRNVALLQLAAAPEAAFLGEGGGGVHWSGVRGGGGGRASTVFLPWAVLFCSLLTRMKTSRIKDPG
jgi:hypothetical protein